MNWKELTEKIGRSAQTVFQDLQQSHPEENFYAFALYTDSSAMTVVASANSTQALNETLDAEDDKSDQTISYYKWSSSEWAYAAWKRGEFKEISKSLREDPDRGDLKNFEKMLHGAMIEALKKLSDTGIFGEGEERNGITLFITITDDNRSRSVENTSAKMLNPGLVYENFSKRA